MSNDKKKKELAKVFAGRMATSAQQIDAVRSGKGQVKGFLTKDTMYRLRQAVADHKKAGDKGYQARLGVILGLCDTYIGRHGTETDDRAREKLEVVEQIKAEALAEGSRRQAEAVYVRDVYAGAPGGGVASGSKFARETQGAQVSATLQTRELVAGRTGRPDEEGFNQATLDLIRKYGLTEAEIMGVKVYTADDYKYINPVMASDQSRLLTYMDPPKADDESEDSEEESSQVPPDPDQDLQDLLSLPDQDLSEVLESIRQAEEELSKLLADGTGLKDSKGKEPEYVKVKALDDSKGKEPEYAKGKDLDDPNGQEPKSYLDTEKGQSHLKQLLEEGSLHGAMAVAALKKLPAMDGLCYRGMRMTEEDFREKYEQPTIEPETLRQLTSVATTRAAAQKFADGEGCRDPNKKVSVLTCVHVQTGRDIGDLSLMGRKEKEWLLFPGTVLQVDSVEELDPGNLGNPQANRWVLIMSHEV